MNYAFICKWYLAIFYKYWAEKLRFIKTYTFDDDDENCLLKYKSILLDLVFAFLYQVSYSAVPQFSFDSGKGVGLGFESLNSAQVESNSRHLSINRHMCRCILQILLTKWQHCLSTPEGLQNYIVLPSLGSMLNLHNNSAFENP